jgi:hypothetical protein
MNTKGLLLFKPSGCHLFWYDPSVLALNSGRAVLCYFVRAPRSCSGSVGLMVHPRWSSPGHNRMHIGACLLDTNRLAAIVRLLLDGLSTPDAAQAAIGHGIARTGELEREPLGHLGMSRGDGRGA